MNRISNAHIALPSPPGAVRAPALGRAGEQPGVKTSGRIGEPASGRIIAPVHPPAEPSALHSDDQGCDLARSICWLRQAVTLASLSAGAGTLYAAHNAGCSLATAGLRASIAMSCMAGLGVLSTHVMLGQIAGAQSPETKSRQE